jgi:hypothetical protein
MFAVLFGARPIEVMQERLLAARHNRNWSPLRGPPDPPRRSRGPRFGVKGGVVPG